MKDKWKNFAVCCANCEKEGKPSLLGPITHSPAYEEFTVSHGLCRRHELGYLVKVWVISTPEFFEWCWLEIKDTYRTLKRFFNA